MKKESSSIAKIKIRFPEEIWIAEIFRHFPDVNMEILYFLPYNLERSIGNALIEIQHYKLGSLIQEIKTHPSVLEFNLVLRVENKIKFNIKTKDPYLLYAVIKCGVLVDFPVKVEDGYAFWNLISTRESIDKLLSLFGDLGIKFELLQIGGSNLDLGDEKYKLSLEELKILEEAIDKGFFDVPRKISLEELGKVLDKSKSTLSVQLRKIIKKKVMVNN